MQLESISTLNIPLLANIKSICLRFKTVSDDKLYKCIDLT